MADGYYQVTLTETQMRALIEAGEIYLRIRQADFSDALSLFWKPKGSSAKLEYLLEELRSELVGGPLAINPSLLKGSVLVAKDISTYFDYKMRQLGGESPTLGLLHATEPEPQIEYFDGYQI